MHYIPSTPWRMEKHLTSSMLVQRYSEETGRAYIERLEVRPLSCEGVPTEVQVYDGLGLQAELSVEERARAEALITEKWEALDARWCPRCERFHAVEDTKPSQVKGFAICQWCAAAMAWSHAFASGQVVLVPVAQLLAEPEERGEDYDDEMDEREPGDYLDDADRGFGYDEDLTTGCQEEL